MNIPVRNLLIAESEAEKMERNLWKDQYASGSLSTNGDTVPVQIRYRGGHTREYPKRSYEVVRQGQTFHYNAEFDDPSMIRNALSFWFIERLGLPSPRTKHVLLVRNGVPLGIYLEIEAVERGFFRRRGIGTRSLFYGVNEQADFRMPSTDNPLIGYEHQYGGQEEKKRLAAFIKGMHLQKRARSAAFLSRHLDVDNYLKWLAGAVLTGNYDGFEQNYAIYRHRASGKWRMVPWDYEGTWGRNCYGRIVSSDLVAVTGYNHLTDKLLERKANGQRYKAILKRALATGFAEKQIMPVAAELHGSIAPYYRRDVSRKWTYSEFQGELSVIRDYIGERRAIIARAIKRM
ncbi:CotH kinase family protein [Cohnella nanjingensis]|nr:CotH kinase family protein [Cohnella nanjingensis]